MINLHVRAFLECTEMCSSECPVLLFKKLGILQSLQKGHAHWGFNSNIFAYAGNKMNWNCFQNVRKHMPTASVDQLSFHAYG